MRMNDQSTHIVMECMELFVITPRFIKYRNEEGIYKDFSIDQKEDGFIYDISCFRTDSGEVEAIKNKIDCHCCFS